MSAASGIITESAGTPSGEQSRTRSARPIGRQSVLIADDSKVIRNRLVSILEPLEGLELRVASDGLEALALAKERKPDLLLCDHEMPGLTGIALLRVLRGTWSRFELPILMLTANSATETKVLAFQHGANDYVTKPVEPAELCARVLGQLDLRRAISDNFAARLQLLEARKYQAVGRLAAGVAHELNNPAQYTTSNLSFLRRAYGTMNAVLVSTLEWAKAQQGENEFAADLVRQTQELSLEELLSETPAAVDEALDGMRRMAGIIGELKEFAGDPHAEIEDLEVNDALRNTVEVSRQMWSHLLDVSLELSPDLPRVRCAAHPIKQAFLNLLTNAAEAAGTRARARRGCLQIATELVDDGIEIRFSDDGPGIAADVQRHIFEPFFTTKPLGKGTGQGLFVAYAIIVEQNGGRLRCESRAGHGATFRVWLPVEQEPVGTGGRLTR